jgi:hypothetical protein
MVPLWWLIKVCDKDKPSPLPSFFPEISGKNILSIKDLGIPGPLSEISINSPNLKN